MNESEFKRIHDGIRFLSHLEPHIVEEISVIKRSLHYIQRIIVENPTRIAINEWTVVCNPISDLVENLVHGSLARRLSDLSSE